MKKFCQDESHSCLLNPPSQQWMPDSVEQVFFDLWLPFPRARSGTWDVLGGAGLGHEHHPLAVDFKPKSVHPMLKAPVYLRAFFFVWSLFSRLKILQSLAATCSCVAVASTRQCPEASPPPTKIVTHARSPKAASRALNSSYVLSSGERKQKPAEKEKAPLYISMGMCMELSLVFITSNCLIGCARNRSWVLNRNHIMLSHGVNPEPQSPR